MGRLFFGFVAARLKLSGDAVSFDLDVLGDIERKEVLLMVENVLDLGTQEFPVLLRDMKMRAEVQEGHLFDLVADALRTNKAKGEIVADGSGANACLSDKHKNREYPFATPVAKIGASECLSDKHGG